MSVYEILFPPDEKYKGMIHLAVLNSKKEMRSLGSCLFEDLPKRIEDLEIMKSRNYYLTANATFQFSQRRSNNLFSLNNIVLDFDIHRRMNQFNREELIEEFICRVKRDLFFIHEPFCIPCCNCLVRTGRGCQMWWHINSTSAKLLFLYRAVIDNFVLIFRDFLSEYPELEANIDLDLGASKNPVGLFRMFNTYNTHTNTKVEVEILHSGSIDLNELNKRLGEYDVVLEAQKQKETKTENYQRNKKSGIKGMQTKRERHSYEALHKKRLAFIKWWSNQLENSIGKRDLMIYLGYNAAVQIMTKNEGKNWCDKLNKSFSEPLNSIEYIFNEIKEPFTIRNQIFYEMLGATENDVERFESEYSKQSMNLTRNAEREKRKQIKIRQKEQAKKMINNGATYKETADTVGLSISTVARIAQKIDKRQTKEKPWEALGISRATYYRNKKEIK